MKNYFLAIAMLAFALSACGAPATLTLEQTISPTDVIRSTNTPFPVIPTETPTLQVLESTPIQTSVNDTAELFSSDQLGLCFSYPQGYTHLPDNDSVEIVAPDITGSDVKGLFWLEISDSYNRTAEKIADQEMTYAAGLNVGRWTVTLDGEQAVVLDGMPGQDLQRRVYVVHQQTLYILAFMPTRSENKAAGDQMEALYAAVTNSWSWSPCSANEQSKAETAMRDFLNALAKQDYSSAVQFYNGDYEELVQWNPDVTPTDYQTLWQRGCEQNGLVCLKLKEVVKAEKNNSLFIFTVTFETTDGKVFETSGCCGQTQKPNFEFLITVKADSSGVYKVISGPPYVP